MSDRLPAAPPASSVYDPVTGEVWELSLRDLDELAEFRDRLGDLRRLIDATNAEIDAEVSARLDRDNVRSAKVGDWELKTEAPYVPTWDIPRLSLALEALVAADKITRKAAAAALVPQPPPPPKPAARELNKLLGHADADVVDAIEACRSAEPRTRRRVTVNRTAQAQGRLRAAQGPRKGIE